MGWLDSNQESRDLENDWAAAYKAIKACPLQHYKPDYTNEIILSVIILIPLALALLCRYRANIISPLKRFLRL